jgi:MoaA/NifB/PqqE/SkfB family radical SAM enzyme
MPEELLLDAISGLKDAGGVKTIGFSGGEPFLFPDLLEKGLRYAKEQGFSTTIATNGFWGAWDNRRIAETLLRLKPDHISFSTDSFHRAFVSDESFGRAVSAARMLKISCDMCIGENKAGPSAGTFFKSMGDYKYLSRFSVYPHVPAGRAKDLDGDCFYRYLPAHKAVCRSMGQLAIRYDGRVFPCCSPYVFDTVLSLGNLRERSIGELLSVEESGRMFLPMRERGFGALIKAASERGIRFRDPCTDGCEICAALFSDGSYAAAWRAVLAEEYGRLATAALLTRRDA